ncbi:hypothetical protein LJB99_01100 [Deltaproteobacteria bacterium OttesenSCG-928-K17]|nr:hypothetical protein [Deltaproteobacteria bacterium OttesenSCG-928-K17]
MTDDKKATLKKSPFYLRACGWDPLPTPVALAFGSLAFGADCFLPRRVLLLWKIFAGGTRSLVFKIMARKAVLLHFIA